MEQADASNHDEREALKSTHLTQVILCLETVTGALPFPLAESAMLTMHLHTGIVHACHANVCTDAALNLLPTDERWTQWRLDALSTGLIAAKSSLSCFVSLPLGHEKSFNNSEWIQLGFVTTCAARLAALSNQKVKRQETHHLLCFLGISDGLKDTIRRLESLSTSTADDDGERDVFYHYRQRVQRIQAWFQAQQERIQRESMQTVSDTADAAAWHGSARQQLPLASSGAQRVWHPGQALPQDSPVLPMDIAWREGELFGWLPDDLMDMENFGQTFPFDAEGTYLICLTIGPAFLSAAIYLCWGRIVVVYGEGISRVQPRAYSILFISCDFLSLVLQGAGGALAATGDTPADGQTGFNIMIAGLSTQVVSLFLFIILGAEFAWRVRTHPDQLDERFKSLRNTKLWAMFLVGLAVATVTIFIRCVFRVAELSSGFHAELFNDEAAFMVLEGPMIIIARICLTIFHPGLIFRNTLADTNWSLRRKKQAGYAHRRLDSVELNGDVVVSENKASH
ncbi:hypothetical protein TI39_contig384g00007 [Zymoseptoria brevis]|uniref:Uncharacterized protein n=1 Tax=Zymoseptoria brevis TaxID=1047168 RepID=A0A0F4GN87_9PEZI|nr:hypothetical protein TI39_contig384g00007 [Zymoseptoria brevis]